MTYDIDTAEVYGNAGRREDENTPEMDEYDIEPVRTDAVAEPG